LATHCGPVSGTPISPSVCSFHHFSYLVVAGFPPCVSLAFLACSTMPCLTLSPAGVIYESRVHLLTLALFCALFLHYRFWLLRLSDWSGESLPLCICTVSPPSQFLIGSFFPPPLAIVLLLLRVPVKRTAGGSPELFCLNRRVGPPLPVVDMLAVIFLCPPVWFFRGLFVVRFLGAWPCTSTHPEFAHQLFLPHPLPFFVRRNPPPLPFSPTVPLESLKINAFPLFSPPSCGVFPFLISYRL